MARDLFLIRGLPGSGKSALAASLAGGQWPVFSVDDYFTDPQTGKYEFRFSENHIAYSQCIANTKKAMASGAEKIFVHNTFTMEWEMEPYFEAAGAYSYRVFCLTVENRHGGGNVHGITNEQLRKMADKFSVRLF